MVPEAPRGHLGKTASIRAPAFATLILIVESLVELLCPRMRSLAINVLSLPTAH